MLVSLSILLIKNIPPNIIHNQECNVYEGLLGDVPIRMMICRNGINLKAYYIKKNEAQEYVLTGTYNQITRNFKLKNIDGTIIFRGSTYEDTENNNLIVLNGDANFSQTNNTFYLTPIWFFSGYDRNNLYSDLGYDTKEVEDFTDNVIELIRRNDSQALATLMSYPLLVYKNDEQMTINNEQEFEAHFDDIMTQDYKNMITQDFSRYLWGNYMGIEFGLQKNFWFYQSAADNKIKITAISNDDENYNYDYPTTEDKGITKG